MSCHKVSRLLLERFRFGELDADCDQYLAHVERCRECQDEIAVDRALAGQLRRALRERVDGFEPSPAVWRAVRLQAADPEPPGPWWSRVVLSLTRSMRVMVPAAALMLAAVLAWTGPEGDTSQLASSFASSLQWREQLATTSEIENPLDRHIEIIPSPSIQLPLPSREMPFADPLQSIKLPTGGPSVGGVIR
jgi:anti-sigma factor RsiW